MFWLLLYESQIWNRRGKCVLIIKKPVVQLLNRVWLCSPIGSSMPNFPAFQYLWEFAQTHVHWVNDVIQPSHPLSPPSPFALNLSQHQDLFQWVGSLHQVAKVLKLQFQHQFIQGIFRVDFFWIDWLDLLVVQRDSQKSSPAPQFKSINSSALSILYGPTLTCVHDYWKKP